MTFRGYSEVCAGGPGGASSRGPGAAPPHAHAVTLRGTLRRRHSQAPQEGYAGEEPPWLPPHPFPNRHLDGLCAPRLARRNAAPTGVPLSCPGQFPLLQLPGPRRPGPRQSPFFAHRSPRFAYCCLTAAQATSGHLETFKVLARCRDGPPFSGAVLKDPMEGIFQGPLHAPLAHATPHRPGSAVLRTPPKLSCRPQHRFPVRASVDCP